MPPAIALGGLCCCFPAGEMPDDRTHVPDPRPAEGAPPPSSLSPTHAARAGVRGKSSWLCCCWAFPSPASSSTRPMLLSWEQPGTRVELLLQPAAGRQHRPYRRWRVAVLMSDGFYGLDVEATISTGPQ